VGRAEIDYVVADLFDWQPPRRYDVVFFSFWLSHVPRGRFASFWTLVRACLAPGGRVFLIDNCNDPEPRPKSKDRYVKDPYVVVYGPDLHLRRLDDGSEFRVVKVMYEPDELESLIEAEGWTADIQATRRFLFGTAEIA
jgi:demethylmenaquinone methyltransferase/2-methoxy-6-polyprenyl-1,4-benzoquinol methylase